VAAGVVLTQSYDLQVPAVPRAVPVNGRHLLRHELHLTNFGREPLVPVSIEVRDADAGSMLARIEGPALAQLLAIPGSDRQGMGPPAIAPGMRAVAYLDIMLPGEVPTTLEHRVEYRVAGGDGSNGAVEGARVAVDSRPPPVLGRPLRGGPWVAVHSPAWPRGHRRALYALDGRARIPGRFAIDWVRVDAQGHMANGDPDRIDNVLGYGADVLAVTDARVAAVRDDVPESSTISGHRPHALADAGGNYVVLDLGDGRHAFYEHLQPGSIRVRPGQRVRRGEVIAALGFTGDSTGPHLHFHVADGSSPLGAEGIPFVIDRFRVLGHYPDIGTLGAAPWLPPAAERPALHLMEWPASNVVVDLYTD
jgi:hypothetical protein